MTGDAKGYGFVDGQNVPGACLGAVRDRLGEICAIESINVYNSHSTTSTIQLQWCADFGYSYIPVLCKTSKNSVDIKIAVDTIAIGYTRDDIRHFFLVTNDSDFTHIASKLLSCGKIVHLLYTQPACPSGYSESVIKHRIVPPAAGRTSAATGARAGKGAGPGAAQTNAKPAKPITASEPPSSMNAQDYAEKAPRADDHPSEQSPALSLSDINRVVRDLLNRSPFYLPSGDVFSAVRDQTGKAWKSVHSKKTAQEFLADIDLDKSCAFVQYTGLSPNTGFFCATKFATDHFQELREHAHKTFQWALPLIATPNTALKKRLTPIHDALANGAEISVADAFELCEARVNADRKYVRALLCMLSLGEGIIVINDKDDGNVRTLMATLGADSSKIVIAQECDFGIFCAKYRRGVLWALSEEPTYMLPSCVVANIDAIFNIGSAATKLMLDRYGMWISEFFESDR